MPAIYAPVQCLHKSVGRKEEKKKGAFSGIFRHFQKKCIAGQKKTAWNIIHAEKNISFSLILDEMSHYQGKLDC